MAVEVETTNWIEVALIYLGSALVAVPIAKRTGLGSVLGYLLAGVLIGPYVLKLVGDQTAVMHFAEFGVVVMLFLIGLELNFKSLWRLRQMIIGLGGTQVLLSALALGWGAYFWLGEWQLAILIGLSLALSSTAIVLQTYDERGWMDTAGGRAGFATLLFQDIAVIPILILIPFLAVGVTPVGEEAAAAAAGHAPEGVLGTLILIGAIAGIVAAGYFLVRPAFRLIAATGSRELFTVAALAIVVGVTELMQEVGLSPALGAFLAGVVLAENEYRHEIESDLEPFRGLLLGLFFISIGASLDIGLLISDWAGVVAALIALLSLKLVTIHIAANLFRLRGSARVILTFSLAQGGEFAFVLMSFATGAGVIARGLADQVILVVTLSMLVSPLLIILADKVILPRLDTGEATGPEGGTGELHEAEVIVAGFGRFGQMVGRLMMSQGYTPVYLDHDAAQVDLVRRYGNRVYYGDASRLDLLQAAGAGSAKLLVVAVDDVDKSLEIVDMAQKHFPKLAVAARARDRQHAYELIRRGVTLMERETFGSAIELGRAALMALGKTERQATLAANRFAEHDKGTLAEMAELWGDDKRYGQAVRRNLQQLKSTLASDQQEYNPDAAGEDLAQDSPR